MLLQNDKTFPWQKLIKWYLDGFSKNSLFCLKFCKLFYFAFHSDKFNILHERGIISKLCKHFSTPSENHGFSLLLLNLVRLKWQMNPDFIPVPNEWNNILQQIEKETLGIITSIVPTQTTAYFPKLVDAKYFELHSSTLYTKFPSNDSKIDLGSQFAHNLGFAKRP